MTYAGKKIIVQNTSPSYACGDWASFGLPKDVGNENLWAQRSTGDDLPVYVRGGEAHVRLQNLAPGEKLELTLIRGEAPPAFRASDWIGDEPQKLIPTFWHEQNPGQTSPTDVSVYIGTEIVETNEARHVQRYYHVIPRLDLFVDTVLTLYAQQDVAEFSILLSYGSDKPNQPQYQQLGSVSMIVGEMPVIDHRVTKGLHFPIIRSDQGPADEFRWQAQLTQPMRWHRNAQVRITGALLCMPPQEQIADTLNDPRALAMRYRLEAPPRAMIDDWEGQHGAIGHVPKLPQGTTVEAERKRLYRTFYGRLHRPGHEDDHRAYGQPPHAGSTGEQPDFGAAALWQVLTLKEPSALFFLQHDLDCWFRRPYANRESVGTPIEPHQHPACTTYILRPDFRFGADGLGWRNPIGWIYGYGTADNAHRTGNLLSGMDRLCPHPHITKLIVDDILPLEQMRQSARVGPGSGVSNPRGWGRPLLEWAHHVAAGREGYRPLLEGLVEKMWTAADFRNHADAADVQALDRRGWKYGYLRPDGDRIEGILAWQESIALIGLWAAYHQIDNEETRNRIREMILRVSKTITKHCFYQWNNRWRCCYLVRWNDGPSALPESAYWPSQGGNLDVYTYDAMARWTLPALSLLLELDPNCPEAARAQEILAQWGPSENWHDSQWAAVTENGRG